MARIFPQVRVVNEVRLQEPRDTTAVTGLSQIIPDDIPLFSGKTFPIGRITIYDRPAIYVQMKTMLKVEEQLVKRSPVETARFRSSWIATKYEPSDLDPISQERRYQYKISGKKFRRKSEYLGKNAWKGVKKLGLKSHLFLSNNVPYALFLAFGKSPQAPPGWVAASIRKGIKLASFEGVRQYSKRKQARRSS